mmetsp:Transcript_25833/g.67810  ORF Transcript_25833/g.67810 Transcript_25833/m.67810 type:complete len:188 (+) Transcript_25833:126-689(+)
MADADHVAADALSFPLPPKYYLEHTDEAVAAGTAPGPPPPRDAYECWGQPVDTRQSFIKPLSDYGIEVLFDPKADRLSELKRLNRETLAEFVSLVNDMSQVGASDPTAKLQRIELLFNNMHHMLNEYRPHQGHETLRAMMEAQIDERNQLVTALETTYASCRKHLAALGGAEDGAPNGVAAAAAAPK